MSKRGTILLAVGLLILGLIVGAVAGGLTGRFLARRSAIRFSAMRMTPGYFGAQGFGRGMMPYYAPGGGYGATPFYGPQRGFRAAPFYGQGRGFGRAPLARRGIARRALRGSFANGARVTSVESNSPADKAGLKAGDIITTVAGTKIDARHSFASLLVAQAGRPDRSRRRTRGSGHDDLGDARRSAAE